MKNMRIPLLIAWGIAVIGIIFGSFFDLSISKAIASPTNGFALTVSAILPTLGFMGVAAIGGGFIAFIVKGKYPTFLKVLFGILAAGCLGLSIAYPAGEYFGINGFYGAAPEWTGYFIVVLPEVGAISLIKSFISVDLPEPLLPITNTNSPLFTTRFRCFNA